MTATSTTRTAFTEAFKELMKKEPFQKISVGEICEKSNKNRKSFYYHYKDKYDLVNKSFDEAFPFLKETYSNDSFGNTIEKLCRHLDSDRSYYKKLLVSEGQNSFSDYLRLEIRSYFERKDFKKDKFVSAFWADATFYSIKEWIVSGKIKSYSVFCSQLMKCVSVNFARA